MTRRNRNAGLVIGAVTALAMLAGAAAWACTGHAGRIWFCSSSAGCPAAISVSPAANSTTFVEGASLIRNRNDIAVRYSPGMEPVDACHTGTQFGGNGRTDGSGNLIGTISGTTPGPGNWNFCATNGTGNNYGSHLPITIN